MKVSFFFHYNNSATSHLKTGWVEQLKCIIFLVSFFRIKCQIVATQHSKLIKIFSSLGLV